MICAKSDHTAHKHKPVYHARICTEKGIQSNTRIIAKNAGTGTRRASVIIVMFARYTGKNGEIKW